MTMTLEDIKDKLKKLDEVILLEVLEISSEELVDRFIDKVEDNFDELEEDFAEDTEND